MAIQVIIAIATTELVVAITTLQVIVAKTAIKRVIATLSIESIVTVTTQHGVVATIAINGVIAGGRCQQQLLDGIDIPDLAIGKLQALHRVGRGGILVEIALHLEAVICALDADIEAVT